MTLKIGSRSPKSNQLVPPSQQCICASLVKIRPLVQKITHGNEATPTGSAPKTICPPPPSVGGDISQGLFQVVYDNYIFKYTVIFCWKNKNIIKYTIISCWKDVRIFCIEKDVFKDANNYWPLKHVPHAREVL